MIIKELKLKNFGVYANSNSFVFNNHKPIVLIGGMNGRGKTTFLESILIALYGIKSFAYKESNYKSYGEYLKSYINTSDKTLETSIELEFILNLNNKEYYRVCRKWNGNKKNITEKVTVYKDGLYNQFLTDNWSAFIESILPSGIANFFFFDGEKIIQIANEDTSIQMKESIKTLLGISILDSLQIDLTKIIDKLLKKDKLNDFQYVDKLKKIKTETKNKLNEVDSEIYNLNKKKYHLIKKLENLNEEYVEKGGLILSQRDKILKDKFILINKMDKLKDELISNVSSELPLLLLINNLKRIRKVSEQEKDQKILDNTLNKVKILSLDYIKTNNKDKEAVNRFINYVKTKSNNGDELINYNLSDTSLYKLQELLDTKLSHICLDIRKKRNSLKNIMKKIEEIDSYISVQVDEEDIKTIYKSIKKIEYKVIEIEAILSNLENKRKIFNSEFIVASSNFNKEVEKYLNILESNDEDERIIKYSNIALSIIKEYKIRLQREKINIVSQTITNCYKKLSNKKSMIKKIYVDPVTLNLNYINYKNEQVFKSSLSAGEKQLVVISFLWALAKCSSKKLPIIIDTPLSRLDSIHRHNLINYYFPNASEQTIILSTDSEINNQYYNLMKENIGDEFTLVYDQKNNSTYIKNGYFMEEQNDN